jgi:hypothetical protein
MRIEFHMSFGAEDMIDVKVVIDTPQTSWTAQAAATEISRLWAQQMSSSVHVGEGRRRSVCGARRQIAKRSPRARAPAANRLASSGEGSVIPRIAPCPDTSVTRDGWFMRSSSSVLSNVWPRKAARSAKSALSVKARRLALTAAAARGVPPKVEVCRKGSLE